MLSSPQQLVTRPPRRNPGKDLLQAAEVIVRLSELPEVHVLVGLPVEPDDLVGLHVLRSYRAVWRSRWMVLMRRRSTGEVGIFDHGRK